MPKNTLKTFKPATVAGVGERIYGGARELMLDRLAAMLCRIEGDALVLNGAMYLSAAEREAVNLLVSNSEEQRFLPSIIASNICRRINRELARVVTDATLHRTFGLWVVVLPIEEITDEPSEFSGGWVIDVIDSQIVGKFRDD